MEDGVVFYSVGAFAFTLIGSALGSAGLGYLIGIMTDTFHSPPEGFRSEDSDQ